MTVQKKQNKTQETKQKKQTKRNKTKQNKQHKTKQTKTNKQTKLNKQTNKQTNQPTTLPHASKHTGPNRPKPNQTSTPTITQHNRHRRVHFFFFKMVNLCGVNIVNIYNLRSDSRITSENSVT